MKGTSAAQELGRRGGRARARRLSPEQRRAIAALGGKARSLSLHAARRINENFRYLQALDALQGGRRAVVELRTFDEPLPNASDTRGADGRRSSDTRR